MKVSLKIIFLLSFLAFQASAQAPVIQGVEPLYAAPLAKVLITGSGFSTDPTKLHVTFGGVSGTVTASTEFSIEVTIPPQAKLDNIEVVNLTTLLSGKSKSKFVPGLLTEPFATSKFSSELAFTAPEEVWDLCSCDLNADGKPDIAATKFASPSSPFTTSTDIMVLQNTSTPGNLSFNKLDKANLSVLNLTFPTDNVVCGDLQGDGKPDLVVSRAGSPRNSIHILRNTSAGGLINFAPPVNLLIDVTNFATRLVLRDLNKDGKPEIIVSNSFNDNLFVFVNQSAGGTMSFNATPIRISIKSILTDTPTNYGIDVQDLNGDGAPDIIVNQFQTNNLYVLKNQNTGSVGFAAPERLTFSGAFNTLRTADFNEDGKLDLVLTNTLNNQVDVLLNQSTASTISFGGRITLASSIGPWGVDVSDIDGDNDTDIIVANRNQNNINVFIHNGSTTTPAFTRNNLISPNNTRNVNVRDYDGDGKPDIAYTSFLTNTAKVGVIRNLHCHKPAIQNPEPVSICNGQTIRLTTAQAANVTYQWTKDGSNIGGNSPFLDITAPGVYRVTATETIGTCALQSDPVTDSPNASSAPADPVITANTPVCIGATLNLQTATVPGATYIWRGPNSFASALEDPSLTAVESAAGDYTLQIEVGGCRSNVVTRRVELARLSDFAISSNVANNTACQGGQVNLSVSSLANHTYQWKRDGADIPGQTTATHSATVEGTYSVTITNTAIGCSGTTAGLAVKILSAPVPGFNVKQNACVTEPLPFTNTSTVDADGTAVYNWAFGDGATSTAAAPTHSYNTSQTFTASLTVTYQGVAGCSANTSKNIVVANGTIPVITPSSPDACEGQQVTLTLTGTFTTRTWSTGATTNSVSVGPGTFSVNTVDATGCPGFAQITIGSKPSLSISATATPDRIAVGGSSQLEASAANSYSWLPVESLSNPSIANPIATPTQTTIYTVTASNAEGCEATAEVTVTVDGAGSSFPVAFSPNGDGVNDIWNIRAEASPDCTLSVFDGRGRRVFENKGVNWDGTYGGKPVPDGTYYFVFGCPNQKPVTGSVLVFK